MDQRCRSDESNSQTYSRPTRDEQATDHESNSQTRERRTMDDAETRLLYHRRLERFVEIVVNSH